MATKKNLEQFENPLTASSSSDDEEQNPICSSEEEDEAEAVMKPGTKRKREDIAGKQRRWTDDDEIALLQGLIDFKGDGGKTYESVKTCISFQVTRSQFMDKIRHLKKKYLKSSAESSSLEAHESRCYQLSKVIWGMAAESEVKDSNKTQRRNKTKKLDLFSESPLGVTKSDWFESSFLVPSVEGLGVTQVKQKWSLVPLQNKKKIEEQLISLQAKELEYKEMLKVMERECVLLRTRLLHDVISMITDAN